MKNKIDVLTKGIDIVTKDTFMGVILPEVEIRNWTGIVLHHSYKPDLPVGGVNYAEIFNSFHYSACKWENGLGYQFVITYDPKDLTKRVTIYSSYRWKTQIKGSHCLNSKHQNMYVSPNASYIGICLVGNYDIYEVPNEIYIQEKEFVDAICNEFSISKEMIFGHSFFENKSCPGVKFNVDFFKK